MLSPWYPWYHHDILIVNLISPRYHHCIPKPDGPKVLNMQRSDLANGRYGGSQEGLGTASCIQYLVEKLKLEPELGFSRMDVQYIVYISFNLS